MAKPKSQARIAIVAAEPDRAERDRLVESLGGSGAVVSGEAGEGVIGLGPARLTVVVVTPALVLAPWTWDALGRLADAGPVAGFEAAPTSRAGNPLARLAVAGSVAELQAWLADGVPAADPGPEPAPAYTSEAARQAGERLLALHALAQGDPATWGDAYTRYRGSGRRRPAPGELLADGRWRLVERRGNAVWTAWDRRAARKVALELEPEALGSDEAAVERFLARLERIRGLAGPGLLPVIDVVVEGEQVAVVREWRPSSLREPTPCTTEEAVQIVLEAAEGLARMHRVGEPHGRVEPAAIWLDTDGSAALGSFGALDPLIERRRTLFDAPESLGLSWEADPRADVFSLGMVLLQLLHGSDLPFWVMREPERLIAGLAAPPVVRDLLRRATEWDLDRRLASAQELVEALTADDALALRLADALEPFRPRAAVTHLERLAAARGGEALYTRLGRLRARLGDTRGALDALAAALALAAETGPILAEIRALTAGADPAALAAILAAESRRRPPAERAALSVELATLEEHALANPGAAAATWQQVLADHHEPEIARTALENLARLARAAGDPDAFIAWSRDLLPYLPPAERPERQAAIGAAYLVELHDELNALVWLDRAEAGGFVSIDLARHLEEIRARKGQWVQAIGLMRRQAEYQPPELAAATLLRAANLARSVHLADASTEIFEAALARDPSEPASLRALVRSRTRAGRPAEALELLQRLAGGPHELADRVELARGLLDSGRTAEARPWIDAILAEEPHQVPSLRMLARAALVDGDTEAAEAAWTRLGRVLDGGPDQIEPAIGRAELAWIRGDLDAAHAGFLRVVELDPASAVGWWGLAKVSISAWGEPGRSEKAPWIRALPARFTAQEALARLLMGVVDPDVLEEWVGQWPLGRALRAGGRWSVRLAAGAVDLLYQSGTVHEVLRRFAGAWPEWSRALDWVAAAWGDTKGTTDAFPIQRSYRWSAAWLDEAPDADATRARAILPPPPPAPAPTLRSDRDDALATLLAGPRPASPDAEALPPDPPTEIYVGPARVPALVRGTGVIAALLRGQEQADIGSDPRCDARVPDLAPRHARLLRAGPYVYLLPHDGPVRHSGVGTRLHGGETIQLGPLAVTFRWYERDEDVPATLDAAEGLTDPGGALAAALAASGPLSAPLGTVPTVSIPPGPPQSVQAVPSVPPDPGFGGEYDEVPAYVMPRLRSAIPESAGPPPMRLLLPPTDEPLPPGLLETNPGPLTGIEPARNPSKLTLRPSAPPQSAGVARIALPAPPRSGRIRGAVEVMSGPERGYTRFVHGEITVGRGREAAIHIASDTQLSRVHCRVVERNGAYFLIDNGSTRGTVVNGKKIGEVELKGGEVIMAGRTVFSFKLVEEEPDLSDDATDMQEAP